MLTLITSHRYRELCRAEAALLGARRVEEVLREERDSANELLRVVLRGAFRETPEETRARRSPETQARVDRVAASYAHADGARPATDPTTPA